MPSIHQIRGALLEEALLALLRASGYRTVVTHVGDDCLAMHRAGLAVKGRGCDHQIDAVADHVVAHPFSNAQRLLVEAKNYNDRRSVGIETIRNSVGVLKDVAEFVPPTPPGVVARRSYHYQFAVFSASGFSPEAQAYAFAHDVYLLQLTAASRMGAVLRAIDAYAAALRHERGFVRTVDLAALRQQVRRHLQPHLPIDDAAAPAGAYPIEEIIGAVKEVGSSVVAVVGRTLPILMTPESNEVLHALRAETEVTLRIERGNQRRWIIRQGERALFSFDVPEELFTRYVVAGAFNQERALWVKDQFFREIQFVHMRNNRPRVAILRLRPGWIEEARAAVRAAVPPE